MNNLNDIAKKVRELDREFHDYVEGYSKSDSAGWPLLILSEIKELRAEVESVQNQIDELNKKLDEIRLSQHGQATKTALMKEVEKKFGKPISELLKERKVKTVRAIADELGVSKSTVASWLKVYKKL
jgi:response regulator of citrate/malate metabolism